jgi:uncharacterized membrane protein
LLFVGFTIGMASLTVLDLILIWLTSVEYQRHKAWHERQQTSAS